MDSNKTQAKHQSMQSMQSIHRWHAVHAHAVMPMSAERRPGVRIPDKDLCAHVRAQCTAAGANNCHRAQGDQTLHYDVDDTAKAHGRSMGTARCETAVPEQRDAA